ncbi:MAG: patatin-like phospholipase family protein [Novosphingobium sp.]
MPGGPTHQSGSLREELAQLGQTVLVLQGGGALGAYQVGVYQALNEAGLEPDWVIGTSIGAINASLIAGNAKEHRMEALREFWQRVERSRLFDSASGPWFNPLRTMQTIVAGIPNFFAPQPLAFVNPHLPLGADNAGYYSTAPLRRTLEELVDFDRLNDGAMRTTVGAARVQTAEMVYFDSRDARLSVDHIMASGALPPAFPAVRIDGELYWDGGIVSNTPVEAVFDDEPRQNAVVFAVHLWNPHGAEPDSIWQVMNRQKDVQYASRAATHIKRQRQLHRLRHVIQQIADKVPADAPYAADVDALRSYGCETRIHVLRLLAPQLDAEDHTKDIDFSPRGISERWQAGYAHTVKAIELGQWRAPVDPLEGFVLHESMAGEAVRTQAAEG